MCFFIFKALKSIEKLNQRETNESSMNNAGLKFQILTERCEIYVDNKKIGKTNRRTELNFNLHYKFNYNFKYSPICNPK